MIDWNAKWIKPERDMGDVAAVFQKRFTVEKAVEKATITMTAMGIYESTLNGRRISDYVLAPGWTTYKSRLQYQEYDITEYLMKKNELLVTVGKGWYRSPLSGTNREELQNIPCGMIAQMEIVYIDGSSETLVTDEAWNVLESEIRLSEIYDGEVCDARFTPSVEEGVRTFAGPTETLILQEGEKIVEHERLPVVQIIQTPKGETVIDFGQEITGYVEITVHAAAGERVCLSHGEVLDSDGNFYNENYRSAKAMFHYTCRDGLQTYHPRLTFYGFRYVRVDEFPGGLSNVKPENFKAIAVYSDIKRTGYIETSSPLLNRFYENVIWGQKDNFLDVPTDCPQRDERLGWTGDAQVFVRAAAYNFDVDKFFYKWLRCLKAEQEEDGYVGDMVPIAWKSAGSSCAWGDAAVICPWEIYLAYGNKKILESQFESMKNRVDYISNNTKEENLWIGGVHYGDWLALDSEENSFSGKSNHDLLATAFYAYSTSLLVKAGKVLGQDMERYERLYDRIVTAFQERFSEYRTQTECAVAIHFRLAKDCQKVSDQLAQMIRDAGMKLQTGFVGTPYLLYALSDFGHSDIAYSLLLREEYPSWLYAVKKGATTVWEHWDSIKEDGSFWSPDMNSFNHYAYGAVVDWMYRVAGGIAPREPGYKTVRIAPIPDGRLNQMRVTLQTRYGTISSEWIYEDGLFKYKITTPVEAEIIVGSETYHVQAGTYVYEKKETSL